MTAVVHVYRYDKLGRRVLRVLNYIPQGTTDPADWVWSDIRQRWERGASDPTAISHGAGGEENRIVRNAYRDVETASNVTGQTETQAQQPDGTRVVRRLDRLGRALTIGWDDPASTPDVAFAHNLVGSRIRMEETGATGPVRTTHYAHDRLQRLTQVAFDSDGDGTTDQTVRYEYDAGGLRTRLTLPGEVSIAYRYDAKGRLVGLTGWDGQASDFFYDGAGRHVATQRASGLLSDYRYNPAGHLRRIRHFVGTPDSLRARFDYVVDARGSRTQASERLAQPATVIATYGKDAPEVEYVSGTWTDAGAYKRSAQFDARIRIAWTGDEGLLTVGTGPDHSLIDVYIGGSLWQSYDCWAPTAGERVIPMPVDGLLEINNRAVRNPHATGTVMRFKQLEVLEVPYDERTIRYTYDAVSRLIEADYDNGAEILTYGFDVAGNLTNLNGTARTYNAANQLVHDGTNALTYDPNGNMTGDGVNSYTWDRANRLLALGGVSYAYNGDGDRVAQTSGVNVTQYLLDLQPGLALVLGDSDGNRYVHAPHGIHAVNDGAAWTYPLADGLGSVRGYVDANNVVLSSVNYTPVGVPDTSIVGPAFTGEQRDSNALQYHRARYYAPGLGIFPSLDPFEGMMQRPMSLNGYAYAHGNPVNLTDPTGQQTCDEFSVIEKTLKRCTFDVNRAAHVARGEAQGVDGDNYFVAAAAIALSIINNDIRSCRPPYPFEVLTGYTGVYIPETRARRPDGSTYVVVDRATGQRIYDIVEAMSDGLCRQNDPLAVFRGTLRAESLLDKYHNYPNQFPEIVANFDSLQYVASNPTMIREHSYVSDNVQASVQGIITKPRQAGTKPGEGFPSNARDTQGNILEEFKGIVIRGTERSVVVSNDFNPLPFEWNCPADQNAIVRAGYDPNSDEGSSFAPGLSCQSCSDRSARRWWWRNPDTNTFEELDDSTFQSYVNPERPTFRGGSGWVKSCS